MILDSSSNMMTGSQLRKEKQEFEQLYQLELALRKNKKETSSKYAEGVVSSKLLREEISEEEKQRLLNELEKDKMARTKTTDWQPNAILCKRFGLMDPYRNKEVKTTDFNKHPDSKRRGKVEFVEKGAQQLAGHKGDEFFYRIQKTVNKFDSLQKHMDKSDLPANMRDVGDSNYVDVESESGSDMEGVTEINKASMDTALAMTKRPQQGVFEDIFN